MLTKAEVQRLRSLREKKHRESLGLFVVEGEKVIAELLTARFPFLEIYATEAWGRKPKADGGDGSPRIITITADEMARISHFPNPSAVLAVGRIARQPLVAADLNHGLTLALDGVQDAGNVGTLLRIADWFGFDRVALSLDCADLFHQKVINASMGSFSRVRTHNVDLAAPLSQAAAAGTPVFGCDLEGTSIYEVVPPEAAIVVIGSEGRGLSPAVAAQVTQKVTIPRLGQAESLNAAVAAGIVCAQLRRGLRT